MTGGRSGTTEAPPASPGSSRLSMDGTVDMGSSASASSTEAPGSGKEKGS